MRKPHHSPRQIKGVFPWFVHHQFSGVFVRLVVVIALLLVDIPLGLIGEAFAQNTTVFGPEDFLRKNGKPKTEVRTFSVATPTGPYTLCLANGGQNQQYDRVSSAVVTLNGVTVLRPNDFNQNVRQITRPVVVKKNNTLKVEVRSLPGSGFSLSIVRGDSCSFTNQPPLANAGPDQSALVNTTITLDGSQSSDGDGDPLTYEWSFVSKPSSTATLSDPSAVKPTFFLDKAGTYILQLLVNDGTDTSVPDQVVISTQNSRPVADAGEDQSGVVNGTITLDGSGSSDVDGDSLTYQWSLEVPQGSSATLTNSTEVQATFMIDKPGTYTAQLIVSDGTVSSDPDTLVISTENSRPVADAGDDQTVPVGMLVQLDGTLSGDVDGDTLTYQWTLLAKPDFSGAALVNAMTATPGFTVDKPGNYSVQLIVNDGTVDSEPDTVVISTRNSRPVADAGEDQSGVVNGTIILDGSGSSDVDGDSLTYGWAITTKPDGSNPTVSDPSVQKPTFTPDQPGLYVAQLIVGDGTEDSEPDTVRITVDPLQTENHPPVANAGPDQSVNVGTTVNLTGSSSSDPDNDPLAYQWVFITQPGTSSATLVNADTVMPSFTADVAGTYRVQLTVSDGNGGSDTDDIDITVATGDQNQSPAITSTAVISAAVGQTYHYDVEAIDPDVGDTLTYSLITAPAAMTIDPVTGLISWTPDANQAGNQNVTVQVDDGKGGNAAQSFTIEVSAGQINRPPTAEDDRYAVRRQNTLTVPAPGVLGNDSDPDNDPLTAQLVTPPAKGDLNLSADGSFTYTPAGPPPGSTEPILKFSYSNANFAGASVVSQPLIVDLNKDGVAEIVFIVLGTFATRRLIAVHGNDGSEAFSVNVYQPNADPPIVLGDSFSEIAAGDIDGDGFPEIIAVDADDGINVPEPDRDIFRRQLLAFEHDGSYKWTSQDVVDDPLIDSTSGFCKPNIADINGDGIPEIVVGYLAMGPLDSRSADYVTVFDNQGRILWTARGGGSSSSLSPAQGNVIIHDIDLDGDMEILYSDDVYDHQGNLLLSNAPSITSMSVHDVAVANLDDDPFAEIVYLDNYAQLYVYEHTGVKKWGPIANPGSGFSLLTVGDADGDGKAEILITAGTNIRITAGNGSSTRLIPVPFSVGFTYFGTTIFDLNGDGKPELIHLGAFGPFDTAEGARGAVFIFDGQTGTHLHSIKSANAWREDLIPIVADVDGDGAAEIVTSCSSPESNKINVFKASNGQWSKARPIYNQFSYSTTNVNRDGTIPARPEINWLTPGLNNYRVNIPLPEERTGVDTDTLTYKANDGTVDSNTAAVYLDILPPNSAPSILSQAPTTASPNLEYLYIVRAVDPDAGEVLTFSLAQAPTGMTINPATGLIRWTPTSGQVGNHVVALKVTDSQGEFAYQGFTITAGSLVTVPGVVGQTQAAAQNAITGAGLTVGTTSTSPSDTVAAGNVISQEPIAGTSVPLGSAVNLVVSSGPQGVSVPNVVGQTQSAALSAITNIGLSVGAVTTAPSTSVPAGNIISQTPAAGNVVPLGSAISFVVSSGVNTLDELSSIVVEPAAPLILAGDTQAFTATGVFSDGTSQNLTAMVTWTSGSPGYASIAPNGVATGLAEGVTTVAATTGSISGNTVLTVRAKVQGDFTEPAAAITSPIGNSEVNGPIDVIGTASDANFLKYVLEYAPAGETAFIPLATGISPVTNGVLGKLDPTLFINDLYTIRLTVFDTGGNQASAAVTIQVKENQKVGLFTLTFQDLGIPLAGISIIINRTYDSRDKRKGDFGIGWRLEIQTLRIRTNRVLGTGWIRQQSGSTVSLLPTDDHKVSLTLPDGKVEEFDMQVSPTSGIGGLNATNVVDFTPRAGTQGTLTAMGDNSLLIVNAGAEDELVDYAGNTYHPRQFQYTSSGGQVFIIDRVDGVLSVQDCCGSNTLTFGPDGISHSTGKSVSFVRDAQGRITQITDPNGKSQTYAYDANGDLVTHTDQLGNVTRFIYNRQHDLLQITDPLGHQVVRNEYDASGRLIATTDANGNRVTFTHNLAAQEEVITNTRGAIRRILYNAQGNVTSDEQVVTINGTAVNAVTTSAYDAQGNETSRVDPDGLLITSTYSGVMPLSQVVDPGGVNLGTSYTYNARNDVTAIVDPAGRTFSFSYNSNGNITQVNTPMTGTTAAIVNAQGQPSLIQDSLGNTRILTYDSFGNVTREEVFDGAITLLRRTDFTYDANGNKLTETLYRTIDGTLTPLTTQFTYDAANRVIIITDPAGGITGIEYDAAGHETARTNPLGQRTTFVYDARGNMIRTNYPDGTFETAVYDSEGNLVSQNDRAGRTTTFEYDELNRQVKTVLPNGASVRTIYSAGGRIAATIDAKGNRTDYTYDTAGRRTVITSPQVTNGVGGGLVRPQVSLAINRAGSPDIATDPNGRQTEYQYDTAGRPSRITFADGSFVTQQYDALGRIINRTNEEGQTTTYSYDGLGRLKTVTGLDGNATYTYDEAGNLLTQTDALGRITRFRYDLLNRLIEKQYPGGETEHLAYDALGNVTVITNANGQVITLTYDNANRVTRKTLPDGSFVAFTYTNDGQRASVTDARGITTYSYDALGQVTSVTHPTGDTVSYSRDINGNLLSLAAPAGTVSYSYDALNRLTGVTAPEGQSQYFYDLAGNRVRLATANSLISDAVYDVRNRPIQLTHRTVSGTVLQSFSNVFSLAGRRTQVTELDGSVENYTYDAQGRLTEEVRTGTNPFAITHAYDATGNRTQTVKDGIATTFTYDVNDRLLSDGTATYTYDANGNLTTQTAGSVVAQYGYDSENRLTSFADATGTTQFTYDADGNRVQSTSSGSTTQFLVDTENNTGLSQILEEKDGTGTLQARYTYGTERLAMVRGGVAGFYHHDVHGSVRALTDNTGAVTDIYQYDGYGRTVSAIGSTINPYRYSGERLDTSLGLYHLRARYYNPLLGRFISRDPFGGRPQVPVSLHRYLYANADPVNNSDPTGLFTLPEISLGQLISNTLKAIDTISKATSYCRALQKLESLDSFVFWSDVTLDLANAGLIMASVFGASPAKTEIPLISIDRKRFGSLGDRIEKVELIFTIGGGVVGIKFSVGHSGDTKSGSLEVSGPPAKFSSSFGENQTLEKFRVCYQTIGEVVLQTSGELGVDGAQEGLVVSSASFSVEITLLGFIKQSYPLFSIDVYPFKPGFKVNFLSAEIIGR